MHQQGVGRVPLECDERLLPPVEARSLRIVEVRPHVAGFAEPDDEVVGDELRPARREGVSLATDAVGVVDRGDDAVGGVHDGVQGHPVEDVDEGVVGVGVDEPGAKAVVE